MKGRKKVHLLVLRFSLLDLSVLNSFHCVTVEGRVNSLHTNLHGDVQAHINMVPNGFGGWHGTCMI